jgi:hypothetical protein
MPPLFGYSRRQRQARGGVIESLRGVHPEIAFRIGGIAFGADPHGACLPSMESLSMELITLVHNNPARYPTDILDHASI